MIGARIEAIAEVGSADEDEIARVLLLTPDMIRNQVVLPLRHLDVPDVPAAVEAAPRLDAASESRTDR